jgi:antitoxin ParD1/3/4
MTTMNISLPDSLKAYVDEQVNRRRYGSTSEYVRELIRRDLDRSTLRDLLLDGAESAPAAEADEHLLDGLRDRARATPDG